MKNIIHENPFGELDGRILATVNFVKDEDVSHKSILNIGCGFGWCELNFLGRGVKQMTGTEISEDDLKTARENILDKRVSFVVGSAIQLPFPSNSFDTVVSWEVIEHIPKKTENVMFAEVFRVLKPRGIFYLSTPHFGFFSNILDPAWWLVGHRHYSKQLLSSYARKNNFRMIEVTVKGKWWMLFSLVNMYVSKWIFRRRPFFGEFFARKEREEYLKDDGFGNIFVKFQKN